MKGNIMAELVIGFFRDGERVGSETIHEAMERLTRRNRAVELQKVKYPQADTIVGLYRGWGGTDSFTIKL